MKQDKMWRCMTFEGKEAKEVKEATTFTSSIEDGSCDCSYCQAIRRGKAKQEAMERHAESLKNAIDLLLSFDLDIPQPVFQGFDLAYEPEPIEPDPDEVATTEYLRAMEKAIAAHLGMNHAWVHISINGDFLCSL